MHALSMFLAPPLLSRIRELRRGINSLGREERRRFSGFLYRLLRERLFGGFPFPYHVLQYLLLTGDFFCLILFSLTADTDANTRELIGLECAHHALDALVPAASARKHHLDSTDRHVEVIMNDQKLFRCPYAFYERAHGLARIIHERFGEHEHHFLPVYLSLRSKSVGFFIENELIKASLPCQKLDRIASRIVPRLLILFPRIPKPHNNDCHGGILS